jgi:hypothetical protein
MLPLFFGGKDAAEPIAPLTAQGTASVSKPQNPTANLPKTPLYQRYGTTPYAYGVTPYDPFSIYNQ